MNVLSARVALRDRSLLDVMDLALRFVTAHARPYAKVGGVVIVPCFLVSWIVARELGWIVGWTVAVALASFAEAPFVTLASRLVFDERVQVRTALGAAARTLPRLFGLRLVQATLIAFGAMFFLIPGVWLAALFFFATEVIVLEQATVGGAIARMQRLGTGYFGDVVMALLTMWTMYALGIALGGLTLHAVLGELLQIRIRPSEDEIGGPLALAAAWLSLPMLTTARFFVYLNLRTRREGWDIQTRFAAIAARASAEADA